MLITGGELFSSAGSWGMSCAQAPNDRQAEYPAAFSTVSEAAQVGGWLLAVAGALSPVVAARAGTARRRGRRPLGKSSDAGMICEAESVTLPPSARELDDSEWELVDLARSTIDACTDAGPDQDGVHTMGAAVRAADGRMFPGVNLYHFTGGPCAELVALGTARAQGATKLTTIVAVGNHGRGPVGPCGRDRQVLFDYHPTIRVLLPTGEGVRSVLVTDLMPLAAAWTVDGGTQTYDPTIFDRRSQVS